jgi:hypothetical protein
MATFWKRFANAPMTAFWCVTTNLKSTAGSPFASAGRNSQAKVGGSSLTRHRLTSAIIIASSWGAPGLEVVQQMVEEDPGAVNA